MLRGSFVPRRHARAPASCHAAALLPRREPGAACHALQAQRGRMESERKTEGERERERETETERARERPIGPPLKPSLGPHWGHPGLLLGPSQRPEGVWAPQDEEEDGAMTMTMTMMMMMMMMMVMMMMM